MTKKLMKSIKKNSISITKFLLLPLIKKTLSQIDNEPEKLQTGPAIRKDLNVMNSHLDRIKNKDLKKIYELLK